ncbi:MAG: SRPBCC domain-containing protein [Mangrovibacterium sp.]
MATETKTTITVSASVGALVEKVWECWTSPWHIVRWNQASDDWHTPTAENDLREGGKFCSRMEAKDGSAGFDFTGTYQRVAPLHELTYTMDDGRLVRVLFEDMSGHTRVTETFETERFHSIELQREGWQAILDSFKKHTEALKDTEKLQMEIILDAPPEKVFRLMLDAEKWKEWTSAFNPASRYEGKWQKGASIRFLGDGPDGQTDGMIGHIRDFVAGQVVSIEYTGIVKEGKEITTGPQLEGWAGCLEKYSFSETEGKTLLVIEMDANRKYLEYFRETWPKALDKLRLIFEA